MRNIRTTIGGAISTVGKGLIAACVLPQLAGKHDEILWYGALVGYVINIIGEGLAKLFSADAAELTRVANQVNANTIAVDNKQDKP